MIPMGDLTLKILCKLVLKCKTDCKVKVWTTCEALKVFIISEDYKKLNTQTFYLRGN